MKINWNKRYTTIAVYAFLVIFAALVIGLAFSGQFKGFFGLIGSVGKALLPILYGLVLAYFLIPLVRVIERLLTRISKKKTVSRGRHALAMVLAYLLVLVVLTGLALLIIPQLIESVNTLISNFSVYMTRIQEFFGKFDRFESSADFWENMITRAYEFFNDYLSEIITRVTSFIPQIYDFTVSVVTGIINLVLGFIVSIYIVADHRRFSSQLLRVYRCIVPPRGVEITRHVLDRCDNVFSAFFIGKALDSLAVGLICCAGMYILRLPYPLLISLIIGVTNMIPYFGPFLGAIPCALLILIIDPLKALWFVIFIFVLQQLDGNVIGPRIVGQSIGLSSFWVVFSLLLFGKLFSFVGMLIGSPIFAVIYELVREAVVRREQKQALAAAPPAPQPTDADNETTDMEE